MQTIALAEAEWVDFKEAEETQRRADELKARRQEDWRDTCERLGLTRQLQLSVAREHYKEVEDLIDLGCQLNGQDSQGSGRAGPENNSIKLWIRIDAHSTTSAIVDDIQSLNSTIPYPALLALEEAHELGCFDRFAVIAPVRHFCAYKPRRADPVLLGVIESPNKLAACAVYFIIAEWP